MNDVKKNPLQFLQSSNFWIAMLLAVGGLFIGFPEGEARTLISSAFTAIASMGILRNFFKSGPKPDWSRIGEANFWNYTATIAAAIVPNTLPDGLFTGLQDLANSIIGKNWNGIMVSLFSLGTIIYYMIKPKAPPSVAK